MNEFRLFSFRVIFVDRPRLYQRRENDPRTHTKELNTTGTLMPEDLRSTPFLSYEGVCAERRTNSV